MATSIIGTSSFQIPTNGDLGTMAFQDAAGISVDLATVNTSISCLTDPSANNHLGRKSYIDAGDIWVRIADTAITLVSQIDVEWTSGAYKAIKYMITGALPATSPTTNDLFIRLKIGGTYLSGASDYARLRITNDNGTVAGNSDAGNGIHQQILGNNANNDEIFVVGDIDPGASNMEAGLISQTRWTTTNGRAGMIMFASSQTDGACSGIRLYFGGGVNFTAQGRILVQGLK